MNRTHMEEGFGHSMNNNRDLVNKSGVSDMRYSNMIGNEAVDRSMGEARRDSSTGATSLPSCRNFK